MITELRIQNFKSWKDTGAMRFAPLTGFFGTNSSGKSAILQFLLMLKQTVESSDRNTVLAFNGPYTELGTFRDVVFQHKVPGEICYQIEVVVQEIGRYFYSSNDLDLDEGISLDAVIKGNEDSLDLRHFDYSVYDKHGSLKHFGMDTVKAGEEQTSSFAYSGDFMVKEGFTQTPRASLPVRGYSFPDEMSSYYQNGESVDYLVLTYEDALKYTYYVGPLRDYPQRIYRWGGEQPQSVGTRGETFVPALLASQKVSKAAMENVARSLKELGLVDSFKVQSIAKGRQEYEVLVKLSADATEVPITHVGFGVSQILPVLTLCYYVPDGSTIILEQPEIHLHPAVQAGLADVLIDAIKTRKIQIILESHSEHLLRRLQRRMAEEKFASEDAALYFCEMGERGESHLKPLELNEYGYITNWPEDFFGDEMEDLVEQSKATTRREQKKSGEQQKDVATIQEAA